MSAVFISHKYEDKGAVHTGYIRVGHIVWRSTGPVRATIYLDGTAREPLHLLREEPRDDHFWETQTERTK